MKNSLKNICENNSEHIFYNHYDIEFLNFISRENLSEESKINIVKQYGILIKYIKNPSENVIKVALKNYCKSIMYVENSLQWMQDFVMDNSIKNYKYIFAI